MMFSRALFAAFLLLCCMRSVPSSPVAKSANKSGETRATAICMVCASSCHKVGSTPVSEVIIPPDLDLVEGAVSMQQDLESGNEAGISDHNGRMGIAGTIASAAARIISGIFKSNAMEEAFEELNQKLDAIAESIDALTIELEMGAIMATYVPDRQSIRFTMKHLLMYFNAAPENYDSELTAFIDIYREQGEDAHLTWMYNEANAVLHMVNSTTGSFRRVVAEFGKDILLHVTAGVMSYYAFRAYTCLNTDAVLDEWNDKLLQLQALVAQYENSCMVPLTGGVLEAYMDEVERQCPYGNNWERAQSTHDALLDKYDWFLWSVTSHSTLDGPAHKGDEYSAGGPQIGIRNHGDDNGYYVIAMFTLNDGVDETPDEEIQNAFQGYSISHNCIEYYNHLRNKGIEGSMLCAEVQLDKHNVRTNGVGFHGWVGNSDYGVDITCLYP